MHRTCLKTWITFPRSLFTECSLPTYSTGQLRHELGQIPAEFSFLFLPGQAIPQKSQGGILPPHPNNTHTHTHSQQTPLTPEGRQVSQLSQRKMAELLTPSAAPCLSTLLRQGYERPTGQCHPGSEEAPWGTHSHVLNEVVPGGQNYTFTSSSRMDRTNLW